MKWLKTFLLVVLSGVVASIPEMVTGLAGISFPLGMLAGGATTIWCIERYDLI